MKGPDGEAMTPMMKDSAPGAQADVADQWNAREFFLSLGFRTPNECVTKLAEHFLCVPLSADQRAVLLEALAPTVGPDAPMGRQNVEPRNVLAAAHLLLSAAEYQLC
ncbi:MAG: hypothetical protein FJY92_08015 [Candidatus Hydrogenedentes bacterium]|nr:hypothetical protein [Candidatus Hydrogenedentota bacterium]